MSPETPLQVPQTADDFEAMVLLPMVSGACPFLGLEADGSIMLSVPSHSHRCYAAEVVRTPRFEFQQQFCLNGDHVRCATYQAAVTQPAAHLVRATWGATPRRSRSRSRSRGRWILFAAACVAALLLIAAYIVVGGPGANSFRVTATSPGAAPLVAPAALAVAPTATAAAPAAKAASVRRANQAGIIEETLVPNEAVALLVPTVTPTPSSTPMPQNGAAVANVASNAAVQSGAAAATSSTITITPMPDEVGWWRDGANGEYALNDSFLNAGQLNGEALISAMRFSLREIPRGAPIMSGALVLSGLRSDLLNGAQPASWLVELISERELGELGGTTFMMVFSAPNSVTLPVLRPTDLSADGVNRLELDANALRWLEQERLADAESITARIVTQVDGPNDTLFAWDSGVGPKTQARAPVLTFQVGNAPPTPPPVPTQDLIVATFTPAPLNVVTLVAQQATATFVAQTVGTYTPVPPFATPTPYARSLPTAEAIARELGLPGVVIETPVPANAATIAAMVEYATAVALTTGTYTPVPEAYVTPALIVPPLPKGTATEDERALIAMLEGTSVPYNAVVGSWVQATTTPQNVATAAAMAVQATADAAQNGPATATPWGQLVYTPSPTPMPTATPTTPLVQQVTSFTPTPELLPTATPPAVLPDNMRNLVIFRSDRFGTDDKFATLAYDPATDTAARINASWAMTLATQLLPVSPDGQSVAIVHADDAGHAQIFIRSLTYGSEKQITSFAGRGGDTATYDPAWSPNGDWIAIVSNNSGNDEIYRVSPDGALVEQLTHNDWEWDKHPSWSPDGSQIVFFSNRETRRKQLWVMNADGSNQHQLLASEGEDWDPVWTR